MKPSGLLFPTGLLFTSQALRASARGVTLIELIISLLIVAIIASVSVGAIVDTGSRSPRKVMLDIEQLFALAGDEAAITGTIKGLFVSDLALELRDHARESENQGNVAGAFTGLISSIGSVSAEATAGGDGFTTLEDRGAFPPIEEPGWSKLIYSLQLPEGQVIESTVVAAVAGRNRFGSAADKPTGEQGEGEGGASEPLVRFFPDGSVLPGGSFTLSDNQQQVQITWDTSGHVTLID